MSLNPNQHDYIGTRVTVKFNETDFTTSKCKFCKLNLSTIDYEGTVVSAEEASQNLQKYWGYTVRMAENIEK